MALTGEITGSILASMSASGGVNGEIAFDGSGTDNYNELDNKPSINGVVLEGNKTSADLHISSEGTDNYNDLINKPKINGTTLTGDVSDTQLLIDYNHLINKPDIPDISDIETRLDTAEDNIDDLQSDMSTAEDNIDDMLDDIATIKATDLTQNADISSLKSRVSSAETNISTLNTRVTSAEGSISSQGNLISGIEDDISDINSDVSGLDTRVTSAEGDITSIEGIVGDGSQTVGSDLTDAVNQLDARLIEKKIELLLHDTSSVPTTATSYNLLHDINDYDCIYVLYKYSNNVINGVMVPVDYFLTTSSGTRIQMPLFTSNGAFQSVINVYHHTDTSVYLQARNSVVSSSNYKVSIYGIKF